MCSDLSLRHEVEEELGWDPRLDAREIGVAVKDGIVALTGQVGSYAERCAAEQAAQSVIGVHGVANDIVVKLPLGNTRTDPEIAALAVTTLKHNVREAFRRRALADCGKVAVSCNGGVVTLEGQVHSCQDRQQVTSAAWQAPGVMQVVDNLKIVP